MLENNATSDLRMETHHVPLAEKPARSLPLVTVWLMLRNNVMTETPTTTTDARPLANGSAVTEEETEPRRSATMALKTQTRPPTLAEPKEPRWEILILVADFLSVVMVLSMTVSNAMMD